MAPWTTSTNAARSWSVTFSRSWTAVTNSGVTAGARSRTALASSSGTTPSDAHASTASTSTSSHRASRAWSVNKSDIGDSEYRSIKGSLPRADALPRGGPLQCPSWRSPPNGHVGTVRQAPLRRGDWDVSRLPSALLHRVPRVRPRPQEGALLHSLRPDRCRRAVDGRRLGQAGSPWAGRTAAGRPGGNGRGGRARHPGAGPDPLAGLQLSFREPLRSEVGQALGQALV